jgi:hypothetical protein
MTIDAALRSDLDSASSIFSNTECGETTPIRGRVGSKQTAPGILAHRHTRILNNYGNIMIMVFKHHGHGKW